MGVNINGINQTNIILNYIYIIYSVLLLLPLPNVCPVPLVRNLRRIPKTGGFFCEVNDQVYVNVTSLGLVIIQIRNGYLTRTK